ncbi:MerR family transcriptional regulator [Clostridiaceae bacterium M8S5]|nr:MerR family transcriptional regulator [Clostridiaceae bacterium M8S5]
MDNSKEKYYLIGEVSKICNIPIRTLHYYDNINLLQPKKVDNQSNYRYYSHEQLLAINTIKHFKKAGFSLKEIKLLLKRDDLEYNSKMLEQKCKEIEKNIAEQTILKNRLKLYINQDEKKHSSTVDIKLKQIPACYVAYSRYIGKCSDDEFYLRFTKLNNLVEKNNLHMSGTMMAIYYDDHKNFDYSSADIEVLVKVSVGKEIKGVVRKYGDFLAVVAYHYGSYKTMSETYQKMLEWIESNNYIYTGRATENYIIDVISTVSEHEYITELILPVKKRS